MEAAGGTATANAVAVKNTPALTVPQWLAFAVFIVFVVLAAVAGDKADSMVNPGELDEVRKLALFLIAALLPSDFLVRYGRSILFQSVEDPAEAAKETPATTLAQLLAFAAFVVIVALTLIADDIVNGAEFAQVNEVVRVLIVALLPSDAGIRFGRALYLKSLPGPPSVAQLKRV
jgi:hypothetical protein